MTCQSAAAKGCGGRFRKAELPEGRKTAAVEFAKQTPKQLKKRLRSSCQLPPGL
jgi:hypothetical protein